MFNAGVLIALVFGFSCYFFNATADYTVHPVRDAMGLNEVRK